MIAREFGVLPDVVETEMSEWWAARAWELMQGETIAENKRIAKLNKTK